MATTSIGSTGVTFPDASVQSSASKILQVVQTVKTDTFSTTSTSYVDITGMSASITPKSSSNKILVMVSMAIACAAEHGGAQLLRGSTALGLGDASGSATRATMYALRMQNIGTNAAGTGTGYMYLDSPATTSSTTYKVQGISPTGATLAVNQSANLGNSDSNYWRVSSTITLFEVAA